ncbi:Uncharacterised protein [Burkholderia pseudomallei]|nr:Uncharacterised protein [Burkholderia pseudomallei]CAJ4108292.1 Uncharacterised protein [Burkholderia pseudomallei]CAJ5120055.1 Uncharacterised protein [Burkholderia pseudomallei]CAJ5540459.1 Uncharacterised protein [Burkholderia pseudomallei]CAJ5748721.1 Uncharacterised protein [Burkholderia pseudomallei]
MAARGRASGRYPPDLPDRTSGGHRGRDAGCGMREQTANCKLQTGSLDVLRSSAVETRVNWATQSFQTRQPFRIFELRVFEPSRLHVFTSSRLPVFPSSRLPVFPSSRLHVFTSSRLHVFTSSRLHVFEISRFRDFETSRRSNRSRITRAIQLARSFAHSLTSPTLPLLRLSPSLVRARPTRVGRLASPHRATPLGCERPEAVAPRHAARTP